MAEEHTENGHINQEGREVMDTGDAEDVKLNIDSDNTKPHESPGINSPRHYLPNPSSATAAAGISPEEDMEPQMEFFDRKRQDSDGEAGGEGDSSPGQLRDNDSYHSRGFATISPSHSPGKGLDEGRGKMLW